MRSQDRINNTFWKDLSAQFDAVTPKKLHDYYHNSWSRQFCDDISQFKQEIKRLVMEYIGLPQQERMKKIYSILQVVHPECNFHYQALYQFINYQAITHSQKQTTRPSLRLVEIQEPEVSQSEKQEVQIIEQRSEVFCYSTDAFEYSCDFMLLSE